MSAPLLLAAMVMENRARRPAARRYRLARFAAAILAGGLVLAISAPSSAAARKIPVDEIDWTLA